MEVTAPQVVKKCPHFTELEGSLPYAQKPATCYCLEPCEFSTCPRIYFDLNIVLPSMPWCSKWSLSFIFPYHNPISTSHIPHMCHMSHPSHSWFDQHLVSSSDHKAPHCVVFSTLLLPLPSLPQISSSALSVCVLPLDARDQFPHPCKTKGKIMVLCVLLFIS